jgi:hypothetical protein
MFELLLLLALLGCESRPLGPYASPRIVGQVFDQDTKRVLADVVVVRGPIDSLKSSPPKGAELLIGKVPVRTDEHGRFELASERVLSVVRGAGWDVVSLKFERAGYRDFQTNCLSATFTNSPDGEAVLDIGRIYLQRDRGYGRAQPSAGMPGPRRTAPWRQNRCHELGPRAHLGSTASDERATNRPGFRENAVRADCKKCSGRRSGRSTIQPPRQGDSECSVTLWHPFPAAFPAP